MPSIFEHDAGKVDMIVKRVSVPVGLEELMEGLTKEVLLKKPKDLYVFASEYFSKLILLRQQSSNQRACPIRTVQSVTKVKPKTKKILPERPTRHLSRQLSTRSKSPRLSKEIQEESQNSRERKIQKKNIAKPVEKKEPTPKDDRQKSTSRPARSSSKDAQTSEKKPRVRPVRKPMPVGKKISPRDPKAISAKTILDSDVLAASTNLQRTCPEDEPALKTGNEAQPLKSESSKETEDSEASLTNKDKCSSKEPKKEVEAILGGQANETATPGPEGITRSQQDNKTKDMKEEGDKEHEQTSEEAIFAQQFKETSDECIEDAVRNASDTKTETSEQLLEDRLQTERASIHTTEDIAVDDDVSEEASRTGLEHIAPDETNEVNEISGRKLLETTFIDAAQDVTVNYDEVEEGAHKNSFEAPSEHTAPLSVDEISEKQSQEEMSLLEPASSTPKEERSSNDSTAPEEDGKGSNKVPLETPLIDAAEEVNNDAVREETSKSSLEASSEHTAPDGVNEERRQKDTSVDNLSTAKEESADNDPRAMDEAGKSANEKPLESPPLPATEDVLVHNEVKEETPENSLLTASEQTAPLALEGIIEERSQKDISVDNLVSSTAKEESTENDPKAIDEAGKSANEKPLESPPLPATEDVPVHNEVKEETPENSLVTASEQTAPLAVDGINEERSREVLDEPASSTAKEEMSGGHPTAMEQANEKHLETSSIEAVEGVSVNNEEKAEISKYPSEQTAPFTVDEIHGEPKKQQEISQGEPASSTAKVESSAKTDPIAKEAFVDIQMKSTSGSDDILIVSISDDPTQGAKEELKEVAIEAPKPSTFFRNSEDLVAEEDKEIGPNTVTTVSSSFINTEQQQMANVLTKSPVHFGGLDENAVKPPLKNASEDKTPHEELKNFLNHEQQHVFKSSSSIATEQGIRILEQDWKSSSSDDPKDHILPRQESLMAFNSVKELLELDSNRTLMGIKESQSGSTDKESQSDSLKLIIADGDESEESSTLGSERPKRAATSEDVEVSINDEEDDGKIISEKSHKVSRVENEGKDNGSIDISPRDDTIEGTMFNHIEEQIATRNIETALDKPKRVKEYESTSKEEKEAVVNDPVKSEDKGARINTEVEQAENADANINTSKEEGELHGYNPSEQQTKTNPTTIETPIEILSQAHENAAHSEAKSKEQVEAELGDRLGTAPETVSEKEAVGFINEEDKITKTDLTSTDSPLNLHAEAPIQQLLNSEQPVLDMKRRPKIGDIDQVASVIEVVKHIYGNKAAVNEAEVATIGNYLNTFLENEQKHVFLPNAIRKSSSNGKRISKRKERPQSQTILMNERNASSQFRRTKSVGLIKTRELESRSKIPTSARRSAGRRPLVRQLEADSKELEEKLDFKRSISKEDTNKRSSLESDPTRPKNGLVDSTDDTLIAATILKGVNDQSNDDGTRTSTNVLAVKQLLDQLATLEDSGEANKDKPKYADDFERTLAEEGRNSADRKKANEENLNPNAITMNAVDEQEAGAGSFKGEPNEKAEYTSQAGPQQLSDEPIMDKTHLHDVNQDVHAGRNQSTLDQDTHPEHHVEGSNEVLQAQEANNSKQAIKEGKGHVEDEDDHKRSLEVSEHQNEDTAKEAVMEDDVKFKNSVALHVGVVDLGASESKEGHFQGPNENVEQQNEELSVDGVIKTKDDDVLHAENMDLNESDSKEEPKEVLRNDVEGEVPHGDAIISKDKSNKKEEASLEDRIEVEQIKKAIAEIPKYETEDIERESEKVPSAIDEEQRSNRTSNVYSDEAEPKEDGAATVIKQSFETPSHQSEDESKEALEMFVKPEENRSNDNLEGEKKVSNDEDVEKNNEAFLKSPEPSNELLRQEGAEAPGNKSSEVKNGEGLQDISQTLKVPRVQNEEKPEEAQELTKSEKDTDGSNSTDRKDPPLENRVGTEAETSSIDLLGNENTELSKRTSKGEEASLADNTEAHHNEISIPTILEPARGDTAVLGHMEEGELVPQQEMVKSNLPKEEIGTVLDDQIEVKEATKQNLEVPKLSSEDKLAKASISVLQVEDKDLGGNEFKEIRPEIMEDSHEPKEALKNTEKAEQPLATQNTEILSVEKSATGDNSNNAKNATPLENHEQSGPKSDIKVLTNMNELVQTKEQSEESDTEAFKAENTLQGRDKCEEEESEIIHSALEEQSEAKIDQTEEATSGSLEEIASKTDETADRIEAKSNEVEATTLEDRVGVEDLQSPNETKTGTNENKQTTLEIPAENVQHCEDSKAATKIQAAWKGFVTRKILNQSNMKRKEENRHEAAVKIQAVLRGFLDRLKYQNLKHAQLANEGVNHELQLLSKGAEGGSSVEQIDHSDDYNVNVNSASKDITNSINAELKRNDDGTCGTEGLDKVHEEKAEFIEDAPTGSVDEQAVRTTEEDLSSKPDFYRSNTVVEPPVTKTTISTLSDKENELDQEVPESKRDALDRDSNNNSSKDETDLERDVREAVKNISSEGKQSAPSQEPANIEEILDRLPQVPMDELPGKTLASSRPSIEDEANAGSQELIGDDLSSVGSADSVVTVVMKPKSPVGAGEEKIATEHSPGLKKNLPNRALSTSALEDRVEFIDHVQNSLLEQLSGKKMDPFHIDHLDKELHDVGTMYTSQEATSPEPMEYLYDFDGFPASSQSNNFDPEEDNLYEPRAVRTPLRELPDIAEETETKEDDGKLEGQFCGTNELPSGNQPTREDVETLDQTSSAIKHSQAMAEEMVKGASQKGIEETMALPAPIADEKAVTPSLKHTSELHDSVLTSQNIAEIARLGHTKDPQGSSLKHTSEFHDTVVVPLPSGADMKITNASKKLLLEGPNRISTLDSGNQTVQQAPAGVAAVTSGRSSSNGAATAQTSLKDTAPAKLRSVGADSNQSPPSSRFANEDMESGQQSKKRNNAINNNNSSEKNMETQAATKIQAGFRGYQVRKQIKAKNAAIDQKRQLRKRSSRENMKDPDLEEKSAVKIQAGVRGFLVRRRQKKVNSSASA